MHTLRDRAKLTKLLMLLELLKKRYRLKSIAKELGITVQAVSEYLKKLRKEGFVKKVNGDYKLTKEGIQFLHSNFLGIKEFFDTKIKELNIIDICEAVAKTKIRKGDRVGLFMEKGFLTAFAGKDSSSTGVALTDAEIGEDVAVGGLEGIVRYKFGKLSILKLPSIREGGTRAVKLARLKKICDKIKPEKVGTIGIVGKLVAKKLGLTIDFEFGTLGAAIDACQKGLNVVLFTSEIPEEISLVEDINTSLTDKITYEVLSV